MLPPLTFREIFILLTSDDVQNYALKNYTKTPYRGQKLGHKAMIPLGGPLVIEYLLGIARSSQQRILDYYSGKTDKLPEPQAPMFVNIAALLIALDDQGTPLLRVAEKPEDRTPIVFRGAVWDGMRIEPWMQLWLLYNQERNSAELLSEFMAAHQSSSQIDWDAPATTLAARLFVLMQRLEKKSAAELGSTLYGQANHPLHSEMVDIIQRIIEGEPIDEGMNQNGCLSLLAVALPSEGGTIGTAAQIIAQSVSHKGSSTGSASGAGVKELALA